MRKILLFIFLIFATAARADDAGDILKHVWSPYCKGVSLLECPSGKAEELREEVFARLAAGETKESILDDLYERYGPEIRMNPKGSGREALAYYLPYAFFAAALLLILWVIFIRRKQVASKGPAPQQKIDSHLQKQILEDLDERL